jgi:hypothetical protein
MKKNLIVAVFLVLIMVSSILVLLKRKANKEISYKEVYIGNCIVNLKSLNISQEIESKICNCSYEYLFNKYGEEIYKRDFVAPNRTDSLALIDCMIEALGADSLTSEDVLKQLQEK